MKNTQLPSKETFITEVEVIRSEMEETEVTINGEFVTREKMFDEWGWSER